MRKIKTGLYGLGRVLSEPQGMLRGDLEAAKIAYRDAKGRVFDFHALRHQFISNLARGGVHPKEAQALARHSTITLTMDRYTHLGLADLTSALDRLPALTASDEEGAAGETPATGPDNPVGDETAAQRQVIEVPTMVPSGAENGAERLASGEYLAASPCTDKHPTLASKNGKIPEKNGAVRAALHRRALKCTSSGGGTRTG
jgi:hypothetical protein